MKLKGLVLPAAALGTAAAMILPAERTSAYDILHSGLGTGQRDFRVFNNFTDSTANNNITPHYNFPGATGAVMAIWKGHIEWQSILHGDGTGDPSQGAGLGSGGANFDTTWQGTTNVIGGTNDNIVSAVASCTGSTLAYTEAPDPTGWRIRFCENITWDDGPSTSIGNRFDIQGVACHEYGHALGLAHSADTQATMYFATGAGATSPRSINVDDQNGVRAIYGVMSGTKPTITAVCVSGNQITVTGTNFSASNNQIWFTDDGNGSGTPPKATGVASPSGTSMTATIPAGAGPGDILVQKNASGHSSLSNAWPHDLQDGGSGSCAPSCPDPVSYCTTSPNSVGAGMLMGSTGSSSVAAEDLTLWSFAGPPNQLGIFFYGENQTSVPFGDGVRCVAPGLVGTFRLPVIQIDTFGDVSYTLDWSTAPVGIGTGAISANTTWNFQFWYRDPANGMSGFNLSNGLQVVFCP